jgi:hypothetical protein
MTIHSQTNRNEANKEEWHQVDGSKPNNEIREDTAKDGMNSYHVKTEIIEVRFTKGTDAKDL